MMQHSSDRASSLYGQDTTQRLDLVDSSVKGDSRDSFVSTVSNSLSDEDHAVNSKCSKRTRRIRNIILSVVFGIFVLGMGYWTGWAIGERRNASSLQVIEIDPFEPNTESPVGNFVDMPSSIPASGNSISMDSHHEESHIGSHVDLPSQHPVVSPTSPETSPPVASLPVTRPSTTEKPPVTLPVAVPSTVPIVAPSQGPGNTFGDFVEKPDEEKAPVDEKVTPTYIPGNLTRFQHNLLLSEGLEARIIAQSGRRVNYAGGFSSDINFHILPDGGATFPDTRWWNEGGWIYVSNSEAKNETKGGVGAITFDKYGSVLNYRMVLENTHMNCGGGRTPWNTWVSCEEVEFTGQIYQVDPTGERPAQKMTIGSAGGRWESFAYDIRDKAKPRFFTTEDHNKGCTRRFTPSVTHWSGDEWKMLHEEGDIDYLFINLNLERTGGTFEWTDNFEAAKNNARSFYPQSEGIDIQDGKMYIVCKKIQQLFIFDLDKMTFRNTSTVSGLFDGDPDQMQRILGSEGGLLYFTEEGGVDAGVHARDEFGRFFTILESPVFEDETTGLSFSHDKKHMYVAYQENGILFDVTREDGLTFDAKSLDVKYHNAISSRRLNSQWIGM